MTLEMCRSCDDVFGLLGVLAVGVLITAARSLLWERADVVSVML